MRSDLNKLKHLRDKLDMLIDLYPGQAFQGDQWEDARMIGRDVVNLTEEVINEPCALNPLNPLKP